MTARRAIVVAAIAVVGALAVWLARHPGAPLRPPAAVSPEVRLRLEEIEVRGRKSGERDWDLRAESIEVPRRGGPTVLKQVREAVLYRGGERYLTLEAGEMRLDQATRELSVRGGLTAQTGERVRFSAPSADWDPKQRTLTCAGSVVLELGRTRLTAPAMVCDTDRGEFVCPAGVRVEAGRNLMRADRLVAGIEDEVLAMTGNVRGRFWMGEVERLMTEDELDRRLVERVRFIIGRLASRAELMRSSWRATGCLLLICAAAAAPHAADPPKNNEESAAAVTIESLKSARYDNKTGMAWLEEAVIVHEGSRIAADRIELNTRKRLGSASGQVRFEGERATVASDSARFDFAGRRAVFEDDVRFVTELAADEETPETTAMTCAKLEYFYRQRKGVATGPVRVEQTDQRANGEAAVYDGGAETFTIIGSVRVENDRGETFECTKATLSLKDDTIDLEGPGKGQLVLEEEEPPPGQ